MELGGAEKSLIGLLENLDLSRCTVDLFLLRQQGELMSSIPPGINLLPEKAAYTVLARPLKDVLKEGHVLLTAARMTAKIAAALYNRFHGYRDSNVGLEYSHKFTAPFMPAIMPDREYDLAVSFLTPHYFTAQKVRAKKKIAWIHTDYSKVQVNQTSEIKMWDAYDYIASISPAVSESFLDVFPSLDSKILPVHNILPENLIRQQACAFSAAEEMPAGPVRILSVGRFCTAKNFDNVPDICARIRRDGVNAVWYLIGFGPDESLIRRKITEAGMDDYVIILGKKENPYPYIGACDLYVQPSRYEGHCVSVCEAQLLGKPVVITAYATAPSQLENGADGIIVPMDNELCAKEIVRLVRQPDAMEALAANCRSRDYTNASETEKIYSIL